MRDIFTINGINIIVEYNDLLYTKDEVRKLLTKGVKSKAKFDEVASEVEIVNYMEVNNLLFQDKIENHLLDLTKYINFMNMLGATVTVEQALEKTFGIKVINKKDNNFYVLEGPAKGFRELKKFL